MYSENERKDYWVAFEKSRLSLERWAAGRFLQALRETVKPVIEQVRSEGASQALSGLHENTREIETAYQDVYERIGTSFALQQYRLLNRGKSQGLEEPYREYMRAFALTEAGQRIVGVTDTTLERIRRVLQQGIAEGLGSEEIARNLQRSSAMSRVRARTIARTEVVAASNRGAYLGAKSTGLILNKQWIATRDDRTREDHWDSDGDVVGIDDDFRVGPDLLHEPGDPNGSPGNVINCRCAVAFIPV